MSRRLTAKKGRHQAKLDMLRHFCPHFDGVMQVEVQERQHLLILFNLKKGLLYILIVTRKLRTEIGAGGCIYELVSMGFKGTKNSISTLAIHLGKDSDAS
ncbi:hypothetical protein MKW92_013193 [Papaver armeniacum]|nr:hypothetical protein MKW92_013193 [Papaver armeniacum]